MNGDFDRRLVLKRLPNVRGFFLDIYLIACIKLAKKMVLYKGTKNLAYE